MIDDSSLDNALALLRSPDIDESADKPAGVDDAVVRWISNGESGKYLQEISLSLSSASDARKIAMQMAASWNGALSSDVEFGYLVFGSETLRLRRNFQLFPAQFLTIEPDNVEHDTELIDALKQVLRPYIAPLPELRLFHKVVDSRRLSYIRLFSLTRLPAFVRLSSHEDNNWELLTWQQTLDNEWKPSAVSNVDSFALYIRYLRTVINDPSDKYELRPLERPVQVGGNKTIEFFLEQRLLEHNVITLNSFLNFLTQSLLSDDQNERAVCGRVYSLLADVCGPVRHRIVRLLLGFLLDEQAVARAVLDTIKVLGEQDAYHFLRHNVDLIWDDPSVQTRVIDCLGELAPSETGLADLMNLYRSISRDSKIDTAFNHAVNRIFERHQLARFSPSARQKFDEQIYTFNYQLALQTISSTPSAAVCIKRWLRECIVCLSAYGQMRIESRFEEAVNQLVTCSNILLRGEFPSELDEWLRRESGTLQSMCAQLSDGDLGIVGNYLDLERTIDDPELSDFYGRVYSLVDVLVRRQARGISMLKTNDKLDPAWVSSNQAIANQLGMGTSKFRVTRPNLITVFGLLANGSEVEVANRLNDHITLVNKLESLIIDRNKSRAGHGIIPVTDRQHLVTSQGVLSELLRNTIGVMPGLSSYRDLNGWIRALLRLSETQDITVEDISENETP